MKKIIIRYKGGLGNQMFQYALRCNYEVFGKEVRDDLSFYVNNPSAMPFRLEAVFPNIVLKRDDEYAIQVIGKNQNRRLFEKLINKIVPTTRKYFLENKEFCYDKTVIKLKNSCVEGYWQAFRYVENVRDVLKDRFQFPEIQEERILNLIKLMRKKNSVSLHIRAGDYLNLENRGCFGEICTLDYYNRAIEFIKKEVNEPFFIVFSDDIEWCKRNIPLKSVVWIDSDILPKREEWVDMYLMSCCKHNIIANSTFSWWGAYLNSNEQKIVIAPIKWTNMVKQDELCLKDWIRL